MKSCGSRGLADRRERGGRKGKLKLSSRAGLEADWPIDRVQNMSLAIVLSANIIAWKLNRNVIR